MKEDAVGLCVIGGKVSLIAYFTPDSGWKAVARLPKEYVITTSECRNALHVVTASGQTFTTNDLIECLTNPPDDLEEERLPSKELYVVFKDTALVGVVSNIEHIAPNEGYTLLTCVYDERLQWWMQNI